MSDEEAFTNKIVIQENEIMFSRFNLLNNRLFSENSIAKDQILALKSQVRKLEKVIENKDQELNKIRERLKKQEILEKSKEIQKESVKIVTNKAKKSSDNVEIKKTITELVQEIDACIALLNEE